MEKRVLELTQRLVFAPRTDYRFACVSRCRCARLRSSGLLNSWLSPVDFPPTSCPARHLNNRRQEGCHQDQALVQGRRSRLQDPRWCVWKRSQADGGGSHPHLHLRARQALLCTGATRALRDRLQMAVFRPPSFARDHPTNPSQRPSTAPTSTRSAPSPVMSRSVAASSPALSTRPR
jgi:hypothetical protein